MKKFDLTWGESVAVRDAFTETMRAAPVILGYNSFDAMGYPPHEGDPELINITREVIERQTGKRYDYIVLTNGATGAVTIAMRLFAQRGHRTALTRSAPYFAVYPSMIKAAGLDHKVEGQIILPDEDKPILMIDSPANPLGIPIKMQEVPFGVPVIWDGVYHNNVYTPGGIEYPVHDIMCGSFSKLTGLNGIRVGWMATNDPLLYERMKDLVTAEYCGLSCVSTTVLLQKLKGFHWESFERNARYKLDYNRGEWSKLEKYFQGTPVQPIGMFYYAKMDPACKKLVEKAGVQWMSGEKLDASPNYGRFNLGQENKVIQAAVKAILKADKI